jgi:hypothetical protein
MRGVENEKKLAPPQERIEKIRRGSEKKFFTSSNIGLWVKKKTWDWFDVAGRKQRNLVLGVIKMDVGEGFGGGRALP